MALVLIRRGAAVGRTLALVVAATVALGFVLSHGIPSSSKAYWGDGTADPLQWLGFLAILATCAAVIAFARRRDVKRQTA